MMKSILRVAAFCAVVAPLALGQIYTHGPLITNPAGGAGGLDASAIPPASGFFGLNCNNALTVRCGESFTVPCGQSWNVSAIHTFGYQTGSGLTSTFTAANFRIWSGSPLSGGTVLHDYSGASQLTSSTFSNIYRVTTTTLTAVNRPIMRNVLAGNGIVLAAGTYTLDWTTNGTLASGPWAPQCVVAGGSLVQGSGIQFNPTWAAVLDGATQVRFPFEIHGSITTVNCFALNITQAGGPGTPVTLADTGGNPGDTALNAITLYGGAFPTGWFFGVDLPISELGALAGSGPPFVVTLDGAGAFSITVPVSLPFPITIFYVGLELNGQNLIVADAAKTVTLS